jgi:dihydrolipoamide dehydrogenase
VSTEVRVPDIGEFADVPVIEILVDVGQEVAAEDPLITLESDKATMEIPSPAAGTVEAILVGVGDKVSEGTVIARLVEQAAASGGDGGAPAAEPQVSQPAAAAGAPGGDGAGPERRTQVVVIGSGPGGYSAAFRAADLGLQVTLVERYDALGGVCLNVGCIPSKALLHAAKILDEAEEASAFGISYGEPKIDLDKLRGWKESVVGKLTGGLAGLAKRRKVEVVHGEARFTGPNAIEVGGEGIGFDHCIIAAGSRSIVLPGFPEDDDRIVDSTGALELTEIPDTLLVVGGGIIGLEMATVYAALGSEVTVVELTDQLIPGCDPDLVAPLAKRLKPRLEKVMLSTKVTEVKATHQGLTAHFEGAEDPAPGEFDRILLSVGRRPNGDILDVAAAGVQVTERGFIETDEQMRTNVPHIFAIGDITSNPMLAHKASHEGKVAAEVIAGHAAAFDPRAIPSVAYTDPEVAWAGLNEVEAKAQGVPYEKGVYPWAASGRALSLERPEGLTKVLVDPESRRIIGAGIVGAGAGELIAELVLAMEMGAVAEDLALTIHPHPTLSETVAFADEVVEGTVTDIYAPKRR